MLDELRAASGATTPELRRRLAAIAFARSAAYEAAIARWFQRDSDFPETFVPSFDRVRELPYGENPHQRAAYYAERGARTHLLGFVVQHQGKELSFNNLGDLSAARLLAGELDRPACVIVKHANPCGVAVADTIEEAYAKALAADPVSAYGGVVVVNRAVTAALAEELATQFVEVLFAPAYDAAALDRLAGKEALRVLEHTEQRAPDEAERDYRRVIGGLLVQDRDRETTGRESAEVVCGEVSGAQWDDLLFAWRVAKHVTSNAIVLARRRPDARNRRGTDEPGGRRADRDPEGTRARSLARRRGARLGRLLPVRGRAEARARRRDRRLHPARGLEARRRGDRDAVRSRRVDGLHRPAPLPALMDAFDLDVRRHVYFSVVANGRPPTTAETAAALDAATRRSPTRTGAWTTRTRSCSSPDTTDDLDGEPVLLRADAASGARRRPRPGPGRAAGTRSGSPARFTRTADVETECACCGDRLELGVRDGELVAGADLLCHVLVPARRWWDDIGFT